MMSTQIIRPRKGDLEAACEPHEAVSSGEFVGRTQVEVCDLCGLVIANRLMHTNVSR